MFVFLGQTFLGLFQFAELVNSSIANHCYFEQRVNHLLSVTVINFFRIIESSKGMSGKSACLSKHFLFLFVLMDVNQLFYFERVVLSRSNCWKVVATLEECWRIYLNFVYGLDWHVLFLAGRLHGSFNRNKLLKEHCFQISGIRYYFDIILNQFIL